MEDRSDEIPKYSTNTHESHGEEKTKDVSLEFQKEKIKRTGKRKSPSLMKILVFHPHIQKMPQTFSVSIEV